MIQISENYYLKFDSCNIILGQNKINKKGEETFDIIGYYGDFNALVNGLIKHDIFVNANTMKTLNEIMQHIQNFKGEVLQKISKIDGKQILTIIKGDNNEEN